MVPGCRPGPDRSSRRSRRAACRSPGRSAAGPGARPAHRAGGARVAHRRPRADLRAGGARVRGPARPDRVPRGRRPAARPWLRAGAHRRGRRDHRRGRPCGAGAMTDRRPAGDRAPLRIEDLEVRYPTRREPSLTRRRLGSVGRANGSAWPGGPARASRRSCSPRPGSSRGSCARRSAAGDDRRQSTPRRPRRTACSAGSGSCSRRPRTSCRRRS